MQPALSSRIATMADLDPVRAVMNRAIEELQAGFLSRAQIAASHKVMGLDSQLVRDGTYFVVECDGQLAGCGGWSYRATLYGGDASIVAREPARLDPATDAAKVRAMYTDPAFARRGIGSLILTLCEQAARAAGFARVELMATAAGIPLYARAGYRAVGPAEHAEVDGVIVPLQRMGKPLF